MVVINLYPWRECKKLYEKKVIAWFIGMAIFLPFGSLTALHVFLSSKLNALNQRVALLNQTVKHMEDSDHIVRRTKKEHLLFNNRMNHFMHYQNRTLSLLNALGQPNLYYLCFTNIQREQSMVYFTGYARSIADLTHFFLHWRGANLFTEMKVEKIYYQSDDSIRFQLKAAELLSKPRIA